MKFDTTPFLSPARGVTCHNRAWAIEFATLDLDCRPFLMMVADIYVDARLPLSVTVSVAMPEDVVGALERLVHRSGKPEEIWIDHDLGHGRAALRTWAEQRRISIVYGSRPRTKALTEPLVRDLGAFLHGKRFSSLIELGHDIERWRQSYGAADHTVPNANQ